MPGNPLYPLKRFGETVTVALAVHPGLQRAARATFTGRRVDEAAFMAARLYTRPAEEQLADTAVIKKLLSEYSQSVRELVPFLDRALERDKGIPRRLAQSFEKPAHERYVRLEKLRLQAPPAAQVNVLQSIEAVHMILATVADALEKPPLSEADIRELTTFVAAGFLTRDELTQLLGETTSNRQLLETLRRMVKTGKLPTNALYVISFDSLGEILLEQLPKFRAQVKYDDMRKIALAAQAIELTDQQRENVTAYFVQYTVGQRLPEDSIRPLVAPTIYGLSLAGDLPKVIADLKPEELSPVRRELYVAWQPLVGEAETDNKQLFSRMAQAAATHVPRDAALLERVQLEVLQALEGEVVYLTLPPGWTKEGAEAVRETFAESIAALRQKESVPEPTTRAEPSPPVSPATAPAAFPADLRFNREEFEGLKRELDQHFAGLAAQLEQQFQEYRRQLRADIQRLQQATDQRILRLEQRTKELEDRLRMLQQEAPPTEVPAPTSTPTPSTPAVTPTATVPPSVTPTPSIETCQQFCQTQGSSSGTCRQNSSQCEQSQERYEASGDPFCLGGSEKACCCLP